MGALHRTSIGRRHDFELYQCIRSLRPDSQGRSRRSDEQGTTRCERRARRHAYPNWVASKASSLLGRKADAARYLKVALASPEPSAQLYYDIIDVYESQRQYQNAVFWIDKAESRFDDAPEWIVERIRLYRKMGKKKK